VPKSAVTVKSVVVSIEHGTPSIREDIEGVNGSLIIDTDSNVSVLQPVVSNNKVRGIP